MLPLLARASSQSAATKMRLITTLAFCLALVTLQAQNTPPYSWMGNPPMPPAGGLNGQVLAKTSDSDYQFGWLGLAPVATAGTYASLTGKPTLLGYTLGVQALTSSPTDAQTIYFGNLPKAPTSTANISKVYIRKVGTIKIAEVYCYSGTAGSNESWSIYVRLNNTTDTLIATVGASASERVFSNTSLNIAVAVGDYIEIKSINPTWSVNPLTTIFGGYIYIE